MPPRRSSKKTLRTDLDQRPRKAVPDGPPPVRFSTHKVRAAWFQSRESWPHREAQVELLNRERTRVARELPAAPGAGDWAEVGPSNIGGRMTSAVCHPDAPESLWAGAAGGGVWHSPDAGKSWAALWHDQLSLNVGALAIDPQDPDTLYAGTGEANLSADSHPGVGLYRSMNAGGSWQLIAPADVAGIPRRVGTVAVDPFDSGHLLLGGVGHGQSDEQGMFRSTDGGMTWTRVPLIGINRYRCHQVVFDATRAGRVYATIGALGVRNGIWRRSGGDWEQLRAGLPAPDRIGRTSLAIAPSDPDVLYALIDNGGAVLGVFRSADGGDTWSAIHGGHFAEERQMFYNNTVVVHPTDPDHVLCAGVDLHRTTDGGASWERVTLWHADRGTPGYAHADHHALVMPQARPGLVYDFNDGGLDTSDDGGTTWENRSSGLATNMFYDLAVAQTGSLIAGGAQDNGTLATIDDQPDTYFELTGGDGGWVIIDPTDDRHLFTTSQGMRMTRFRAGTRKNVSPPETQFEMWMVFTSMDSRRRKTVFTGSRRVWRTKDDGDTWTAVSGVLDDSDITALEVARGDGQRVYVGTEKGGVFRSTDGGATWSGNLASTVLPGRTVTRIESRADDVDVVYATVANFGNRHVFRSADGGLTWTDIDRGDLPDAPFHSITIPAAHPQRVYACGDAGVFVSDDEGATWAALTGNLPNVMVVDLVYHESDRTLTAATYGRSAWRLPVD